MSWEPEWLHVLPQLHASAAAVLMNGGAVTKARTSRTNSKRRGVRIEPPLQFEPWPRGVYMLAYICQDSSNLDATSSAHAPAPPPSPLRSAHRFAPAGWLPARGRSAVPAARRPPRDRLPGCGARALGDR